MPRFVTKYIELVRGKQGFLQLVVIPDNEDPNKKESSIEEIKADGVLDLYEKNLEKKYQNSFRGLLATMNRVANLQPVSKDKFRDITPKNATISEYEFKFQDLRVYAIKIPNGQLVLLGGYKNQQDKDFKKFRSLKNQYLESLKKKK